MHRRGLEVTQRSLRPRGAKFDSYHQTSVSLSPEGRRQDILHIEILVGKQVCGQGGPESEDPWGREVVEHVTMIWEHIQRATAEKSELHDVWLDLAKAYRSVPHQL